MQIPPLSRSSAALLLTLVLPPLAVLVAALAFRIPVPVMTRDIAGVANVHPLTGFLSTLGSLLWFAAAAIWLFTATVLAARAEAVRFQISSGLLSAYLGADDLFEFHEVIAPDMLGIPQWLVMVTIAAATVLYVWCWRARFVNREGLLLGLALCLLAGSMGADTVLGGLLHRHLGQWEYWVEDSLKWGGVCFWVVFCVVRCRLDLLRSAPSTAP